MDVIIRKVNNKVYLEFKAKAANKGMKLGKALEDAMKLWESSSSAEIMLEADADNEEYNQTKEELERKYRGKYVALAGGHLAAVAEDLPTLVAELRRLGVKRALSVHVGADIMEEGGEWLWGSIAPETA